MTASAAALSQSFLVRTNFREVALIAVAGLLMLVVLIHLGVDLGSTLSGAQGGRIGSPHQRLAQAGSLRVCSGLQAADPARGDDNITGRLSNGSLTRWDWGHLLKEATRYSPEWARDR